MTRIIESPTPPEEVEENPVEKPDENEAPEETAD